MSKMQDFILVSANISLNRAELAVRGVGKSFPLSSTITNRISKIRDLIEQIKKASSQEKQEQLLKEAQAVSKSVEDNVRVISINVRSRMGYSPTFNLFSI